jgi:type II secretory pathway component GspD/PulD (secretin)
MKQLTVLFAACAVNVAGLGAQAIAPAAVFVVRLDTGSKGAQQATVTPADRVPAARDPLERPAGQLPPLPVTRLDDSGISAILDGPRLLSLRFSEPQPIRQVLMLLVRDTGLSLVAPPDADGTFTGELAGVTLRRALDLVLEPQGLAYRIEGNAVRVFRRETETRIVDVNAMAVRGDGSGDAFEDLARSIAALLSPEGRLGVDRKAGLLHVTDYPAQLARVSAYVEAVERRLGRQVDIQARVIEIVHGDANAPAVDWAAALDHARGGAAARAVDFDKLVAWLAPQGTVKVLTTAGLQALHNEKAIVRVGVLAPAFEGFALAVTPHIAADGTILMMVAPSLSQAVTEPRGGVSAPSVATSELTTAVRVRDGETLVLPGLRRARSEIAVLLTMKVI